MKAEYLSVSLMQNYIRTNIIIKANDLSVSLFKSTSKKIFATLFFAYVFYHLLRDDEVNGKSGINMYRVCKTKHSVVTFVWVMVKNSKEDERKSKWKFKN